MQDGHDDLGGGYAFLFMHVDWDAATVVANTDGFVWVNDYGNVITVAGECLVDRVIDHLEHHVVQAATIIGVANVHTGTLAHGI
ncbi:hypothetical protein D3C80_614640 [compost metagenome]